MQYQKMTLLAAAAIAVAIVGGTMWWALMQKEDIDSFEDCARKYPVMDSYPQQCRTPSGKHFWKR